MKMMPFRNVGLLGAIASCTIGLFVMPSFAPGLNDQPAWANLTVAQRGSARFRLPPPPPSRDAPGNRGGGAGRSCGVGSQTLMALVPEYQEALPSGGSIIKVWGTTIAERPTFWFHVPYEKGAIVSLEFVLQDNSRPAKDLYRTAVIPSDTPGIISIHLPETVSPLETGKLYQWFLKARVQCASNQSNVKVIVMQDQVYGWVQRIKPSTDLMTQLNQDTPQKRADLYAQNGIWFDALTTLGELYLANTSNASLENWNNLLQAVGLEKVATKPIVPCCKPAP